MGPANRTSHTCISTWSTGETVPAATVQWIFQCVWLAWVAYWVISARGVKPAQRHESPASRAGHIVPLTVAVALLAAPWPPGVWLTAQFVPPSAGLGLAGAAITVPGLALTVWARRFLGTNWSGTVTVKQDHQLITTGPYRYVRHPIYSGLLLAFAGSALASGQWRGPLALVIAAYALWRKWRLEERWMRETFGSAYSDYAAHTPAVVPRIF
jgi:protein-S-isoprenylcysteine O-methyltransferase Ste14